MLPEYFAVIGAVIASIGGLKYLYDTLKGKAQPNRVTWLLWGLLPMIVFVAQRIQGVEGVSWATFAAGLTPLLVFVASFFNKAAYWQSTSRDYACLVIALMGIVLWIFTKTPNLAIALSIVADFAAGLPTIIKAYTHPHTESWSAFALSAVGFAVSLLAVPAWTFENYAFVLYLLCANTIITVFAARLQLTALLQKADA